MRIISLNTWGGRAMHPLMHFFGKHGPTTDVFCLQEMHDTTQEYRERRHPDEWVRWDLWKKTHRVLPRHDGFFAAWPDSPDRMSVAMFVRCGLEAFAQGDHVIHVPERVHEEGSAVISPRKLQYMIFGSLVRERTLMVANYHGLWNGDGKGDTPERIRQSRDLVEFLAGFAEPKILCGDLNIAPDTDSFRILADAFKGELVTQHFMDRGTRTPLYRHFGKPGDDHAYADYVFFSDGVVIRDFRVMDDLVSDHAPLLVDLDW